MGLCNPLVLDGLSCFCHCNCTAASPKEDLVMFVGVKVARAVKVKHLPRDQGIMVTPSGRFPSDLLRPPGSFIDGICARFCARQKTLFK